MLSGDRSAVPVDEKEEGILSHELEVVPPTEVRVWIQSGSVSLAPGWRALRPLPYHADPEYKVGDRLCIEFCTNRDAHMYLLNVDTEGKVALILHSNVWRENHVHCGQNYFIPKEGDTFDLPIEGPPGVEMVIAMATIEQSLVFVDWQKLITTFTITQHPISEQELVITEEILSHLPCEQWATGQCRFVIRK